jgi:hypothetical protein
MFLLSINNSCYLDKIGSSPNRVGKILDYTPSVIQSGLPIKTTLLSAKNAKNANPGKIPDLYLFGIGWPE